MSKIILNINDETKAEKLINFLKTIDYVSVDETESVAQVISDNSKKRSKYEKLLFNLQAACQFKNNKWIETEDLKEGLRKANTLTQTTGQDNYITFLRSFLEFLFRSESNIPKNTKDILGDLPIESKTILQYIERNFISESAFRNTMPLLKESFEPTDVVKYIQDCLQKRKINTETHREETKTSLIAREKFKEWLKNNEKN